MNVIRVRVFFNVLSRTIFK